MEVAEIFQSSRCFTQHNTIVLQPMSREFWMRDLNRERFILFSWVYLWYRWHAGLLEYMIQRMFCAWACPNHSSQAWVISWVGENCIKNKCRIPRDMTTDKSAEKSGDSGNRTHDRLNFQRPIGHCKWEIIPLNHIPNSMNGDDMMCSQLPLP